MRVSANAVLRSAISPRFAMARTKADYERQLDARYAAARGYVDAIILPVGDGLGIGVKR